MLLRGILRSAVAMKHATGQRPAQGHRPFECGDGVPGIEAAADRVADGTARPGVENDGDIDEAGGDGDVGQVRHPELVGPVDLEVPRDERIDRPVVVAVRRAGERAAFMYGLITTARLNEVDPQAWLADVLARIAGIPASRLDDLLPWNWRPVTGRLAA